MTHAPVPTSRRISAYLPAWILCVVVVLAWAGSFRAGMANGHARDVGSLGPFSFAVAAVFTDRVFGLGRYVYIGRTLGTAPSTFAEDAGLRWDLPAKNNQAEIERVLAKFAAMTPRPPPEPSAHWPYQDLTAVGWGMDIGYVDFVDLSFALFGANIPSMFFLFHLILILSFLLFVLRHGRDVAALATVGIVVVVMWLMFRSPVFFELKQLHAANNPRFLSVLGLVPAIHVIFAFLRDKKPTWAEAVVVALQSAILFFAFHNRTSAFWACLLLLALGWLRFVRGARVGESLPRSLSRLWVVGAVAAIFLIGSTVVDSVAHPAKYTSRVIPRHSVWTAVVTGLQNDPLWKERYAALYTTPSYGSDGVLFEIARKYYEGSSKTERELFRGSEIWWLDMVDNALKQEVLRLARTDPEVLLHAIFVTNPSLAWIHLSDVARILVHSLDLLPGLALLTFFLALVLAVAKGPLPGGAPALDVVGTLAGGFVISLAPSIATVVYPDSMVDAYFMMAVLGVWSVAAVLGLAMRKVVQ